MTRTDDTALAKPRQKSNFPSAINADFTVQPSSKKYFVLPVGQIISIPSRRPVPVRGALAIVTKRWARDAVDAFGARDERSDKRTAKSCGPDIPTLISSGRRCFRITLAMVTKSPAHQGEREVSR
jgi:hypothetical protein